MNSVSGLLNATNSKIDQVTGIAKGILCLPSFLNGLFSNITQAALSGIVNALSAIALGLADTIAQLVASEVAKITGAITDTLNTFVSIIADIAGTVALVKNFIQSLVDRTNNIRDFISNKENCNFAGAEFAKCLVGQITQSLTANVARDISKGTLGIGSITDSITKKISSPGGLAQNYVNKSASQVNRATQIISKSSIM